MIFKNYWVGLPNVLDCSQHLSLWNLPPPYMKGNKSSGIPNWRYSFVFGNYKRHHDRTLHVTRNIKRFTTSKGYQVPGTICNWRWAIRIEPEWNFHLDLDLKLTKKLFYWKFIVFVVLYSFCSTPPPYWFVEVGFWVRNFNTSYVTASHKNSAFETPGLHQRRITFRNEGKNWRIKPCGMLRRLEW